MHGCGMLYTEAGVLPKFGTQCKVVMQTGNVLGDRLWQD